MAQVMIDNLKEEHPCKFCKKICKSTAELMSHMNIIHPLDSPRGLTCYTYNKLFTNRDLIENHFKTVKHQLECKELQNEDQVKETSSEEEFKRYRSKLPEMNGFTAPRYQPRPWKYDKTVEIPLESATPPHDPRKHSHKHQLVSRHTEEPVKKTWKPCEEQQSSLTRSTNTTTKEAHIKDTIEITASENEGIILHIMDSDLELFPASQDTTENSNKIEKCNTITETRRVYLNNNWQVKSTVGNPAFEGIIENDCNIDWLTFISKNIN